MAAISEVRVSGPERRPKVRELWRFIRAQISAMVATGVDWVLMLGLIWLGVHYYWAVAAGHVAGAITDFVMEKWWAFGTSGGVRSQAKRYAVAWVGSLGLNELLAWLLITILHQPAAPSVIAASLVVALAWNYPMHRWFVFGDRLRKKDRGGPDGR